MPKFLASCHDNDEKICPALERKYRILASPNQWQQACNRSNLEKTGRSCEGADFSWLSSKDSRTLAGRERDEEFRLHHHHFFFNRHVTTTLNMIFSVVTTLSCATLISNSLVISVRHKCAVTFPSTTSFLLLSLLVFLVHILTNTKFVHVTSTHYHSWYLVFEFTFNPGECT